MALVLPIPWQREEGWPPPTRSLSRCGCSAWCTERVSQPVLQACTGCFLFLSFAIETTLPRGGAAVPLAWVLVRELLILQVHPAVPVQFVYLSQHVSYAFETFTLNNKYLPLVSHRQVAQTTCSYVYIYM